MSDPTELLHGMSPAERRMLLASLLAEKARRERLVFPLAHGQRGLWFLSQLSPSNPAYNICHAARIRSLLDVDTYRRAVQRIVDRHASLRTTFEQHDGQL